MLFPLRKLCKELRANACMGNAKILATTMGTENTMGTIEGRVVGDKMTYARVSTDDVNGMIRAYTGEGNLWTINWHFRRRAFY